MPRPKKTESLDARIEKAQNDVFRLKNEYDQACDELKNLITERNEMRQKILFAAMAKHNKSFDDVMRFIESKD